MMLANTGYTTNARADGRCMGPARLRASPEICGTRECGKSDRPVVSDGVWCLEDAGRAGRATTRT